MAYTTEIGPMNIFADINQSTVSDNFASGVAHHLKLKFLQNWSGADLHAQSCSIEIRMLTDEVHSICVDEAGKFADKAKLKSFFWEARAFAVQGPDLLLLVTNQTHSRNENAKTNRFSFEAYGAPAEIKGLITALNARFFDKSYTKINWFFKDSYGVEDRTVYVDHDQKIYDACYPWFPHGIENFISSYLANSASVLLMYGPPGTGKTSFLKHLLCSRKLHGVVTYDEAVLNDDRFFIDFLTDEESDIMIVEDADLLLTSRESDQNKIMSKFLNVSDGLVRMPNKKMVFTTNITSLSKVDQALLRRGRCFATVEFRRLSPREAAGAAEATGQASQNWMEKDSWSLAEVFNVNPETVVEAVKPRFGFGA